MRFQDIVQKLEFRFGIDERGKTAFRGRLKNLQNLGWPEGANTGKGRQAEYTPKMVLDLAFALELQSIGITPERCIATVKANLASLHAAAGERRPCEIYVSPFFGNKTPRTKIIVHTQDLCELLEARLT